MKDFFHKIFSPIVYGNLIAMALVLIIALASLWQWMSHYTRHGEGVDVPDVKGMMLSDAQYELGRAELVAVVMDSTYDRTLPAGIVLEQMPGKGSRVKMDREIYLTVNAKHVPTLPIPDIADNCSLREAEAKLKALGFKLGPIEYAPGDKDWVLGVKSRGRNIYAGDRVEIDVPIVLVVGNNEVERGDYMERENWSDGAMTSDEPMNDEL